ncbi:hypothetical protein O181_082275, partial [Austropuccinia psidii MF-1]|nr:hypothetical protein [Austropuccinia psidii MF-1]
DYKVTLTRLKQDFILTAVQREVNRRRLTRDSPCVLYLPTTKMILPTLACLFLLVECHEVIPVCKLCDRPTTPIKDPVQFTCWKHLLCANCNDFIDACQRKYPSEYGQCMWEDCQCQTPVKKTCEGNHSTGQLCYNCRSKQWQLGNSGEGYGGISSQLENMQLGD